MSHLFLNYNGTILSDNTPLFTAHDRAFRYGDGLFETLLWQNGEIRFIDFHIERLQTSMEILKFSNPKAMDAFFIKSISEELIRKNNMIGQEVRIRLTVFRGDQGLYTPQSNTPHYLLQVAPVSKRNKNSRVGLIVDLYTDVSKPISEISMIKSNNALVYALAAEFKQRQEVDEVLLLNNEGFLCEASSSNIFVYFENTLYTPAISQGCVDGVMRRVMMEMAEDEGIDVVEAEIRPEIMMRADEIFCTNAIQGIQWVMGYRHKRYFNKVSRVFQEKLKTWTGKTVE